MAIVPAGRAGVSAAARGVGEARAVLVAAASGRAGDAAVTCLTGVHRRNAAATGARAVLLTGRDAAGVWAALVSAVFERVADVAVGVVRNAVSGDAVRVRTTVGRAHVGECTDTVLADGARGAGLNGVFGRTGDLIAADAGRRWARGVFIKEAATVHAAAGRVAEVRARERRISLYGTFFRFTAKEKDKYGEEREKAGES